MAPQDRTPENYNQYVSSLFAQEDDALVLAQEEMRREGVPEIHISASEGKMLHVLTLLSRAERILEIGTLGGYSAIWMARALPGNGKLVSLELEPHHAKVARRNVERAGLSNKVEVRVGPALDTLTMMEENGEELFDLVFIDADKDGYADYLEKTVPMVREGGLILADNTLPDAVLYEDGDAGAKRYNTAVAAHPDLVSVLAPMLRVIEGIDGLTISVKRTVG
jgi:predicted O-methyltransferase YrrM